MGGVRKRRGGDDEAAAATVAAAVGLEPTTSGFGAAAKRQRVDNVSMCTPSGTGGSRTAHDEESPATGLLPSFLRYAGVDDAAGLE